MTSVTDLAEEAQTAIGAADWPRAARALEGLIEASPRPEAPLLYNLGLVLKRQGDLETAAGWFERAVGADARHANARFELAATLMELGRPAPALSSFEAYLERSPEDADALLNAARLALRLGRAEDAAGYAERLHRMRPTDLAVSLLRADIAVERGRLDDAVALYKSVIAGGEPALRAAALSAMTHRAKGRVPLDPRALTAEAET